MWPASWSGLAVAVCLLQVLLPMGEPVAVFSLLTSCFVSATEDDTAPASEDAEDEAGDELPCAVTPHRVGVRRFCPLLDPAPQFRVMPRVLRRVGQDRSAFANEIDAPVNIPLRC